MIFTVYRTTNQTNGKFYIGVHKTTLALDDYLGSGVGLKRAIKKYGVESFRKEIIAEFDNAADAFAMEMALLTPELLASPECYNMKPGGKGGDCGTGKQHTTEYKAQMSVKHKGNQYFLGRKHSEATKEKLRLVRLGKKMSDEHKAAISRGGKGHVVDQGTRDRIAAGNRGKIVSAETRAKQSAARTGVNHWRHKRKLEQMELQQ